MVVIFIKLPKRTIDISDSMAMPNPLNRAGNGNTKQSSSVMIEPNSIGRKMSFIMASRGFR